MKPGLFNPGTPRSGWCNALPQVPTHCSRWPSSCRSLAMAVGASTEDRKGQHGCDDRLRRTPSPNGNGDIQRFDDSHLCLLVHPVGLWPQPLTFIHAASLALLKFNSMWEWRLWRIVDYSVTPYFLAFEPLQPEMVAVVGVVPFGVASDLLALATARTLLRRAARASTGRAIVTLIGGAFAVGFGALAIPMLAAQFVPTEPGSWSNAEALQKVLVATGFSNLPAGLASWCFGLLAGTMLCHRAAWHLPERPLYAVARHELVRRPKLLLSLGGALLAAAGVNAVQLALAMLR